ncbi:MAG: NRDE family protein [Owenweeksia sp.]|nr:NRDE family protein [Owenweeksia sp.]
MCTLSYFPTEHGFTLTHNRDERMNRPTSKNFQKQLIAGTEVYYPEDLEAHGSWIAFSKSGKAVCLMNGGEKDYNRQPPYRHSRGIVVLDIFKYPDMPGFYNDYNFTNLEPFTVLIREHHKLWKLSHDVDETTLKELDIGQMSIWSSTTLYSQEVRDKREAWFKRWLATNPTLSAQSIRRFHKSAGDGDQENDLIMSRWGILKTLSITQIAVHANKAQLTYEDFVQESMDQIEVTLNL